MSERKYWGDSWSTLTVKSFYTLAKKSLQLYQKYTKMGNAYVNSE